jgi:hypothetical protein
MPVVTISVRADPTAILQRHAIRRETGVATVSVLVGPVEATRESWRGWVTSRGQIPLLADLPRLPWEPWLVELESRVQLPGLAIQQLARRSHRGAEELTSRWPTMTPADRAWFRRSLALELDDAILEAMADLAVPPSSHSSTCSSAVSTSSSTSSSASARSPGDLVSVAGLWHELGDPLLRKVLGLVPSDHWPAMWLTASSGEEIAQIGQEAVTWCMEAPKLSIAVSVAEPVWAEFLATVAESRGKSILKEGEILFPRLDTSSLELALRASGVISDEAVTFLRDRGVPELLEAAMELSQVATGPSSNEQDEDRARSAAERFLFLFLESLPETAGRFELNAQLDFRFGSRAAEIDLLCRSSRLALELDGYFHFLSSDRYRRDRAKDWELQRRNYVVLRFLAEDVLPQLEMIRDRILEALSLSHPGEEP